MADKIRTNAVHQRQEVQYELRRQIIRLFQEGKDNAEIAKTLDVSERHVRATKEKFRKHGIEGILLKKRGRKIGAKRLLSPEQEREIKEIISTKTPEETGFNECMWNRKNIRELINQRYEITLCLTCVGRYLKRWGFSLQRPAKRERKQDPEKIQAWVEETYPDIASQAKEENAEIFFLVMRPESRIHQIMLEVMH